MKNMFCPAWAMAVVASCTPSAVLAQSASTVQFPAGWAPGSSICVKQTDGTCKPVSVTDPLPVTGGTGGGGASASGPAAAAASQSITPQTLTTVRSGTYGAGLLVKNGAGRLYGLTALSTATGYVQPFDAVACPADGAVAPLIPTLAYTAIGQPLGVSFGDQPLSFTTGLVLCFSSTGPFTRTSSATASFSAQVQ